MAGDGYDLCLRNHDCQPNHLKVVDDDSESFLRLSEANGFDSDCTGLASVQLFEPIGHLIGTTKDL